MMKRILLLVLLAITSPLHAEPATPPAASAAAAAPMSEGVVRKIDAASGKITLKHGAIANLDMPPMTMVFRVQPPELLNKVKAGDTVKFRAEVPVWQAWIQKHDGPGESLPRKYTRPM